MRWTVALSWGPYGGFYLHRHRICLGWVALTVCPGVEIDDLMEAYVDETWRLQAGTITPPGTQKAAPKDGSRAAKA